VLVALGFTAVLAIATTGFITACYRSMQLSNRAFNGARSIQFAEMGMEEALWSMRNNDWSAWTISGSTATRTITGFSYPDGCSGEIHLRLQNYNTPAVAIVVEGQTTLADGSTVKKQLVATAAQSPVFASAIFSTYTTNFMSGGIVDSYNSADGPYDPGTAGYAAIVGGSSVGSSTAGSVIANNANIQGYVAYSGLLPTFGSSGSLRGPVASSSTPRVDTSRYVNSPWQAFPDVKPVTGGSPLPSGSVTIGTPGATVPSVYYTGDLGLYGGRNITVEGPVVLDVAGSFYSDGNSRIIVTSTGSIELHHAGTFYLGGYAIENRTLDPKKAIIISTGSSTDPDEHNFFCTQPFYGILYVPNAPVAFHGWVQVYGAVTASSVLIADSPLAQFHYDMALRSPAATFNGLAPVIQLTNWREITDPAEIAQF
jgi:hypothetical protein